MTSVEVDRAAGPDFVALQVREPLVDLDATSRLGWGVSLRVRVSGDADRFCAERDNAGVRIIQPSRDSPFGRFVVIADPAGYAVTLHAPERGE